MRFKRKRCFYMLENRDINVLRHIISYCDDIANTIQRFGLDYETFEEDTVYKNAVALCVRNHYSGYSRVEKILC